MPFTFKRFHIDDSRCGMPVSTDGVLLGAWAPLTEAKSILDIGAGSGLLSLMAAQRSQAYITAVELEPLAAADCLNNFAASPWSARLALVCSDIASYAQAYSQSKAALFEHIICNPPYFANGPQSDNSARAAARHTDSLSFDTLLQSIKALLAENGTVSLILPSETVAQLEAKLAPNQLELCGKLSAASVEGKAPNRHILLLSHAAQSTASAFEQQLTVRLKNGQYSNEFIQLSKDFYLKL
ncbi:tRNA1(Val) (adenine(37)-N6)-methyltransferase [Shewanella fidelis]|uniref:tRNA1(Val) (adenine(37)-N6)-methyltransferase n=1 Tax=Shewanella fidelis TaxID=173509 RepID=A0AAW8NQE3_9GAMM|nr:methyltransferase [Shewanella fidelis]MDR8525025.1 methyltransferase [Shewanella fidelis]MDW4811096.1 methyltransferase [Shewanella fidelis]MDW4815125.1 methyltransferase [Shewanella fidelis]MDW4819215.1 methyltransferase [Shewanella fidelis]MDW4823107.1 methyltransferase [Shewanella fidelis]